MICKGDSINMSQMKIGSNNIAEVFVGNIKVWPDKIIGDLDAGETPEAPDGTDDSGYVDMGEAGIWHSCNLGASHPWENGKYYAWGETTGWYENQILNYHHFNGPNYRWVLEGLPDSVGGSLESVAKYCYDPKDGGGEADFKYVLELEDDAAHVELKGDWKIPSISEWKKLISCCDITEHSYQGVAGKLFTLKSDPSKKLFFPNAGMAIRSMVYKLNTNEFSYTANSNIYTSEGSIACDRVVIGLSTPQTTGVDGNYGIQRYFGLPIRPILAKYDGSAFSSKKKSVLVKVDGDGLVRCGKYNQEFVWKAVYRALRHEGNSYTEYFKPTSGSGLWGAVVEGADFAEWKWEPASSASYVRETSDNSFTYILEDNVVLTADYTERAVLVNLKSNNSQAGTVSFTMNDDTLTHSRSKIVGRDKSVTIYARAAEGYTFFRWDIGGSAYGRLNPSILQLSELDNRIKNNVLDITAEFVSEATTPPIPEV